MEGLANRKRCWGNEPSNKFNEVNQCFIRAYHIFLIVFYGLKGLDKSGKGGSRRVFALPDLRLRWKRLHEKPAPEIALDIPQAVNLQSCVPHLELKTPVHKAPTCDPRKMTYP